MKNIHILATSQPSILIKDVWKNTFSLVENFDTNHTDFKAQHIYITSDEEIKKGDWCLDKFNQRWKLEDKKLIAFDSEGIKRFSTDNILGHECKKIILSTDQELIKDGVQAIEDEFLEWFVKNPSCELVKTLWTIEAAEEYGISVGCDNGTAGVDFIAGAKYQQEQQEQQDEFAIGFAEWCIKKRIDFFDDTEIGRTYTMMDGYSRYKMNELLEIFKNK